MNAPKNRRSDPGDDLWGKTIFRAKPITLAELPNVYEKLLRELLRPLFEEELRKSINRFHRRKVSAEWWLGLDAFSRMWGKKFSADVGAGSNQVIFSKAEAYERFVLRARRYLGNDIQFLDCFDEQTLEATGVMTQWPASIGLPKTEVSFETTLKCALLWDAFPVPMRYFTNEAAYKLWYARFAATRSNTVLYDSFRHDVRGVRALKLKAPSTSADTIVRLKKNEEDTFVMDSSKAAKLELAPRPFSISFEGSSRVFKFEFAD